MATTYALSGKAQISMQAGLAKTDGTANVGTFDVTGSAGRFSWTLADGTGASEANDLYSAQLSIAASSAASLDLNAVAGTPTENVWGVDITWASVKAIFIKADATNGDTITLGGGSNNIIATNEPIPAGGSIALFAPVAGWTVTAATADILTITNNDSGDAAIVDVFLIGVKA